MNDYGLSYGLEDVRPYLRPISSMTKDEEHQYLSLMTVATYDFAKDSTQMTDWCNTHHFDYRGLIDKGLALEAPDGLYK